MDYEIKPLKNEESCTKWQIIESEKRETVVTNDFGVTYNNFTNFFFITQH